MNDNGKGDAPRQTQDQKAYEARWDEIFGSWEIIECRTCGEKTEDWNDDGECPRCVSIRKHGRK